MSGAVRNKKEMRRNLCAAMGFGSNNDDAPLTVFSAKGTYLRNGEQFSFGIDVYECVERRRDTYGWVFACRQVRRLTKAEFVEKKWPKPVHGKAWSKK